MDRTRKQNLLSLKSYARRAAGLEIWVIPVLVLAGMLSTRWLPAAICAAILFWLTRWIGCGRLSYRTPADWAIVLLICTLPVTLGATPLPEITLPQVYRLLSGVALYYTLANWATTPARVQKLVDGITLAGLGLALIAPFSVIWTVDKLPYIPAALYDRFSLLLSDTIHPNVMAGSLVILLPVPLAVLLFSWRRLGWSRGLLAGVALLAMSGMLALTQSRGAWLAFAAALAILCMLRWRAGWVGLALLGGVAGMAIYRLGLTHFLDLFSSSSATTLQGRLEIWSRAIFIIRDFPFTGIGMGSFSQVVDALYPYVTITEAVPHAHNLFLQVAVDLGLPGLVAWLAVWMLAIVTSWELYKIGRSKRDPWSAGLGAGLLASQAALAVHGLTDAVTWGMVRPAPLVWVLWGLAFAGWMVARHTLPEPQNPGPHPSGVEGGHV